MGFKTWSVGDVLTASDVNAYLMKQTVIVCTSATRPSSPVEGMTIYETDTDLYQVYSGSAWIPLMNTGVQTWTTTWGGSITNPTLGNGTLDATWSRFGRWVSIRLWLTMGSTTTYGSGKWTFTTPTTPAGSGAVSVVMDDSSATTRYAGSAWITIGTGVFGIYPGNAGTAGASGTIPFTWAAGDQLMIMGMYESSN